MAKTPRWLRDEQLLGEIDTHIVGMRHHDAQVEPGEQVNLEREPENPDNPQAIRVENGRFEPVGHLPRRLSSWLAPLIDSGLVRFDAHVPREVERRRRSTIPLSLAVFLGPESQTWLRRREVRTQQDVLHAVVRRAYEDAQGHQSPELILELFQVLQSFAKQDLLPETRLLLEVLPSVAREVRGNQAFGAMARLQNLLGRMRFGKPVACRSLTLFPLAWTEPQEPFYVLLQTAIEQGTAVVEEVSENGDVPHLAVTSTCDLPILITEGEILVGAKQNRVVNITVLVPPRSRFTLPVSCVERGRWHYRSRHFTSEFIAPPSLRSKKSRAVQRNRIEPEEAHSDQGEVWEEVDACLCGLGVNSETSSLTDSHAAVEKQLQEFRTKLELPEGTAGILVARGGQIVGMDLFGSPGTFATLSRRLTDAYFLDALRARRRTRKTVDSEQAREFLDRIVAGARPRISALGQGEELEIQGEGIVGSALLLEDRICHLAAFCEAI